MKISFDPENPQVRMLIPSKFMFVGENTKFIFSNCTSGEEAEKRAKLYAADVLPKGSRYAVCEVVKEGVAPL